MAIWPFKRRKQSEDTDNIPSEVQEYYASERKERVGLAWLLAFGTLVATIVLAIGIFFGGRWIYRKIAGNDKSLVTEQTQEDKKSAETTQTPAEQPATAAPQQTETALVPAQTTATPSQSEQKLTKAGPADTLAIFIGTTIVGSFAHQVYTRRKLAR